MSPGPAAVGTAARPIMRRIAGSTNTSNEMYDETGLPGSVKIGVSSSPIVPKPCGLPGCIADLRELHGPEPTEDVLDHVVVALADAPAGHDQVSTHELVRQAVGQLLRVVGNDTHPVGNRVSLPGGSCDSERVGVIDRVEAQRRPRFAQLAASGDDDHPRPRPGLDSRPADGGHDRRLTRTEDVPVLQQAVTTTHVLPRATGRVEPAQASARSRRWRDRRRSIRSGSRRQHRPGAVHLS